MKAKVKNNKLAEHVTSAMRPKGYADGGPIEPIERGRATKLNMNKQYSADQKSGERVTGGSPTMGPHLYSIPKKVESGSSSRMTIGSNDNESSGNKIKFKNKRQKSYISGGFSSGSSRNGARKGSATKCSTTNTSTGCAD